MQSSPQCPFFCVALVGALCKAADQLTSTAVVVRCCRNLICFVVIIPVAISGGPASLRTDKIGLHVLRAATGTACWYALFVAITMMPLTNAVLLTFSAPLWMPGWPGWCLVRKHRWRRGPAPDRILGVILVLQPQHHHFNIGTPLALAGALLLAVALMSVRWLGATEPMPRILFYYFLFSTVMVLPLALVEWRPLEPRTWIYLIGVGVAQLFSQVFIGSRTATRRRSSSVRSSYNDCLRSVDRLGPLASVADVVRRPGHGVGHGGGLVAIRGKTDAPLAAIEVNTSDQQRRSSAMEVRAVDHPLAAARLTWSDTSSESAGPAKAWRL